MSEIENYKDTLNLPSTDFPMKASLAIREPSLIKKWQDESLYFSIQKQNQGKKRFILLDGPPYANGDIHMGHALNKVLKDIVVKSRLLSGFDASFVPGWDCHGLPIELNVEKTIGKPGEKVDAKTFREKCRDYANKQIASQKASFIRLGVLGDWQHPYQTMDYSYEADIVRSLGKIVENGHIHKGYKPVYWCTACASALAEAEVEYQGKTSPAIDVCFEVVNASKPLASTPFQKWLEKHPAAVVIWTTTPWTLPANEAVALNADLDYALVKINPPAQIHYQYLILASQLVAATLARAGVKDYEILAECKGKALEGTTLLHPFYTREVPIVLGEHVTLETGTGAVHTAPAHGQEDFIVGEHYHLPLENPVDPLGRFYPTVPLLGGEFVFKANDKIINILKENHKLLHHETLQHSYPHCWRHKTPLIFRATQQWFISMDQKNLRQQTLDEIQKVNWIPDWGQARISNMIASRPDWCISRQRTWGVPMCFIVNKQTGDLHSEMPSLMTKIAEKIEKGGVEAWFDLNLEALLGQAQAQDYEKTNDTLDVWFDSGVAHTAVGKKRPELGFPADLYLEGSDQHRGWFHSSLLTSVAMVGRAPYRAVLTHGFMVDAQGRKMSKSLGNVDAPDKIINQLGADVLRLWVASTDYSGDLAMSEEILKRISDTYRRIRNTARFLLANLNGFDPEKDLLKPNQLLALDRWIVERAQSLQQEIIQDFQDYQFHLIYQKFHHFCSIDLGSFYLDVIKDRQYTGKANGIPRRSAQTALYHIAEALTRWMAPILSFTAEEIWQYLPGKRGPSVFLSEWYQNFPVFEMDAKTAELDNDFWITVLSVRDAVNKALEAARASGKMGSGLEAELTLYCAPDLYRQLSKLEDELRFVLISSQAKVYPEKEKTTDSEATDLPDLWVRVVATSAPKCVRCWHRRKDVNQNHHYPGLCARCVENVAGPGEIRHYA